MKSCFTKISACKKAHNLSELTLRPAKMLRTLRAINHRDRIQFQSSTSHIIKLQAFAARGLLMDDPVQTDGLLKNQEPLVHFSFLTLMVLHQLSLEEGSSILNWQPQ